jgi:hypothetical protein
MDLSLENEDHVFGGSILFVKDFARLGHDFLPVAGEPEPVFKGKAMKGANMIESVCNIFDRSESKRGDNGGGKHPGPPGVPLQDRR